MLFNTFDYFIFLPVVFALYWFVFNKSLKWQNIAVLAASYFFYGWWNWKFLGLLGLSTLLDYYYGFFVASPNRKKAKLFLWLSVLNNLGILAVFKYYNFFITEFESAISVFGIHFTPWLLKIALPVGISFYTFHGMSYVFDIYRGKLKPIQNFVEYALFVAFFPLLVAGPIERANHLLPQIQTKRFFNYQQAVEGCRLILWGLFKKIVIADSLAVVVNQIYDAPGNYNSVSLLIGMLAFSFQIYGDFSGYSDIAMGSAKLLGFELLSNFRFPYFSRDIAEFWRRWHISLSSWFKDYVYIPLGGSKEGKFKAFRNTIVIFLLSGFWHGASWNFIVWGGIHACGFLPLLFLNRNRKNVSDIVSEQSVLPSWKELGQLILTFTFVTIAWVFFRAHTLTDAVQYLNQLFFGLFNENLIESIVNAKGKRIFLFIIPLILGDWYFRRNERQLKQFRFQYLFYFVTTLVILYYFLNAKSDSFIYFQF